MMNPTNDKDTKELDTTSKQKKTDDAKKTEKQSEKQSTPTVEEKKTSEKKVREDKVNPIPKQKSEPSTSLIKKEPDATPPLNTLEECQREIARLSKIIASMQVSTPNPTQPDATIVSNVEAFKIHKQVQEAETKTYDVLKGIANRMGPQLAIKPIKLEKPSPFTSPLKINILAKIPSLFKVRTIDGTSELEQPAISAAGTIQPAYLAASQRAFKFGITEASFVMESDGLMNEIKFSPGGKSILLNDVRGLGTGPVNLEASRTDYIFMIFETLFKLYLNSQFILSNVEFKTQFDRDTFAGDLVSVKGMLKNQFVDQSVPLLPAAGYGHSARYLLERLGEMFTDAHHGMQIGELARDSLSQRKVFRRAGVVTDQYIARLNEIYLDYLFARSIDHTSYIMQHRALTLPNVSIKVDKPSVFANSLIPIWRRSECDGCLLVYALDVKRQQKYLLHLTELLASLNLLTFASADDIAQLPPRRSLRDAEIQQLLDNALTSVNEAEVYRAIALDLSTSWVDTSITIRGLSTTPLDAVFKVFTVILWFCYFPSIARDNVPKLMFELFSAMEELASDETNRYVRHNGFSNYNGRNASIQEYPKELYLNGTITYPLLLQAPPNRFRLFRQLHELLVVNHGEVQNTSDNDSITTPRMSDVRQYYQPYHSLSAVSNAPVHGENPNDFGNRLKDLHHFMKQLIEEYKRKYRDYSNRSAFGNSTSSVSQLLGYFDAYNPALLYSIGIRGHAELFVLRQLGANSPYVPDCQNLLAADQRLRPQVLFELDNGDWSAIMMQRHQDELPFELPLFTFLTLRGAHSIEAIMPPDASIQFQNLLKIQEEGILCGDVIRFVNNIKFGNVGVFNREALGISNIITAARSDRIFTKLSEISSLSEFSDLFSVLINDVSQRIDNRAVNFRIVMQPYLSAIYNPRIPQPPNSLYGVDLRLGRQFMDQVMTIASPLFVPETSPISLYTTGLAVQYTISNDLDPFSYIDIQERAHQAERIVMYAPDLLTRRVRDGSRFIDEDVIQLPNPDGETDIYQLGDDMPFTIIIVNSVTGPISNIDYHKLVRFLKEKKIMFYYPELMLIMNRVLVEQHVLEEVMLESQLLDVLTGSPTRRITLTFGDTVSKPYRLANSPQKFKFLYPVNAINQRQIILKGMSDPIQAPPELQIGTWMSWAYGGTNGKTIIVREGELYRNGAGDEIVNEEGEDQVIDKLEMGFVNMNNEMRVLTMPEYLTTPQIEQDSKRAYVGIYTVA